MLWIQRFVVFLVLNLFICNANAQLPGLFLDTTPLTQHAGVAQAEVNLVHFNQVSSLHILNTPEWRGGFSYLSGWYMAPEEKGSDRWMYHGRVSKGFRTVGQLGVSFTYLNLGEQIQVGETGPEEWDTFHSYVWSLRAMSTFRIGQFSGVGFAGRMTRTFLAPSGAAAELDKDGASTDFSADMGFTRFQLFPGITVNKDWTHPKVSQDKANQQPGEGIALSLNLMNVGPRVAFIDADQAEPPSLRFSVGGDYHVLQSPAYSLRLLTSVEKPLEAYDDNGRALPVYQALFAGWSNEKSERERKDFRYRTGVEMNIFGYLTLRGGVYRYPYLDEGFDQPYRYTTWGGTFDYRGFAFSWAFLVSDLIVLPWNQRYSISIRL